MACMKQMSPANLCRWRQVPDCVAIRHQPQQLDSGEPTVKVKLSGHKGQNLSLVNHPLWNLSSKQDSKHCLKDDVEVKYKYDGIANSFDPSPNFWFNACGPRWSCKIWSQKRSRTRMPTVPSGQRAKQSHVVPIDIPGFYWLQNNTIPVSAKVLSGGNDFFLLFNAVNRCKVLINTSLNGAKWDSVANVQSGIFAFTWSPQLKTLH